MNREEIKTMPFKFGEKDNDCTLFVKNLDYNASQDEVEVFFAMVRAAADVGDRTLLHGVAS